MTFDEYQRQTAETAVYPRVEHAGLWYVTLGLCGEAGEIANKVKKIFRDRGGHISQQELRKLLMKEIGDCQWYLSQMATEIGAELDEIAQQNLDKLADRKSRNALQGEGDER